MSSSGTAWEVVEAAAQMGWRDPEVACLNQGRVQKIRKQKSMGRQHKQRLESRLSCAVTEPAPTGAAQPEYSSQPKGWYGESKMKVGLSLCLGLWVISSGLLETRQKRKKLRWTEKETRLWYHIVFQKYLSRITLYFHLEELYTYTENIRNGPLRMGLTS